jgi:hypothetical protein
MPHCTPSSVPTLPSIWVVLEKVPTQHPGMALFTRRHRPRRRAQALLSARSCFVGNSPSAPLCYLHLHSASTVITAMDMSDILKLLGAAALALIVVYGFRRSSRIPPSGRDPYDFQGPP